MEAHRGLPVAAPASNAAAQLRRVFLNALSLLGAYVLPRIFTFAAAVVAARVLGVEVFGAYGSAAALAVILSLLATLGMMQLLVREIARGPERAAELMGAAHLAKTASVLVMLAILVLIGAGPLGYEPDVLAALTLLGLAYGVGAFAENLGAYFQGVERMGVWLQAQALYGFVFGTLGIVLVLSTRSLVWFCAAPVFGQLAAAGWLLIRSPAPLRRAWGAPWPLVASLLRSLAPFAAAFVLLTAYYKTDILLLERWRGGMEAGLYAAAYKFVDIAQALSLVLAAALYPRLSRLAMERAAAARPRDGGGGVGDPAHGGSGTPAGDGRWAAGRAAELLLLAGVPAAALLWLIRDPLIGALFGDAYHRSAALLGVLAPALPFLALNALGTFILAASERIRWVAALFLAGLVLNVGLNALLIPAVGAGGAAVAKLASEATIGALMLLLLRHLASAAPRARPVLIALSAAALAALIGSAGVLGPGAAAAMYLALIAAGYAAADILTPAEKALLRRAVGR